MRALPFDAFRPVWALIGLGALTAVGALPLLWFLPVIEDLVRGNVHVLMAAAIVAGFRWPAAWAFPILTKVTPAVGLVWFAVRGEWRAAAVAALGTATVVGVSVLLGGVEPWSEWLAILAAVAGTDPATLPTSALSPPLLLRIPAAVLIVAWGAWTGRAWVVPIAVLVALPVIWPSSWALLVASVVLYLAPPSYPRRPTPRMETQPA